jgi:hypothetical protein
MTREQHVPVHPAPGDTHVHRRFVSGSEATVLQVHHATGWIGVRRQPVQGTEHTGWVTQNSFAQQPGGGGPTVDHLAWCPAHGPPAPHHSGCLRIATQNLENLHAQDGQSTTGQDYALLMAQIPMLEGWIDEAARGPRPFIVLGDFNRRFNQPGDQVWADLDDGDLANADLTALTQDMPMSYRGNTDSECIDHLVVDPRVLSWVDRSSFRQVTCRQADKAVWDKFTDHCPV